MEIKKVRAGTLRQVLSSSSVKPLSASTSSCGRAGTCSVSCLASGAVLVSVVSGSATAAGGGLPAVKDGGPVATSMI